MRNKGIGYWLLAACLAGGLTQAGAQVLAPEEIKDPAAAGLQRKYMTQLKAVAAAIQLHQFRYPFYFSRTLGADLPQQRRMDQRSIRFQKYKGQMVLQITGNYYASYSSELMDRNERARQTYREALLPIIRAAAPRFANDENVQGYGLEVSHHIRRKVIGVTAENAENVVLLLPRAAAERLAAAKSPEEEQSALLEAEAFVNAEPLVLWVSGERPQAGSGASSSEGSGTGSAAQSARVAQSPARQGAPAELPALKPAPAPIEPPARVLTRESLARFDAANQELLARLVKEMEPQAHFVSYSPPAFIDFRRRAYLQLTLTTSLEAAVAGSRYKLAALAFDEHIARLIRPLLAHFPKDPDFDGIDFSTSVELPGAVSSLAVEFIFPFSALRSYAQYDYTGQQLIDAGFVLINGERVGLDLQLAERN